MSFTINMEQIGDIIERVLQDLEDKKIRPNRRFSDAGMAEICHLHERLTSNLRLAMSVFRRSLAMRASSSRRGPFRELEREYAANIAAGQSPREHRDEFPAPDRQRLEATARICSVAYDLDSAGALLRRRGARYWPP
jgi:phosphate:Na+ symporter